MAPSIDKVEVVLLNVPRNRGMAPAENLLVRIYSNDGISGVGACQYESRYGETGSEAAHVIAKHFTPLLLKENPLNIETIMAKLDAFMPEHLASKAALDIALHDLKGKMLNLPVYELLGGRARDRVQLLAPQVSRGEPVEQAREAARLIGEGFKALKLRVGGADVEKDIQRVKEVRQAVGTSVEIRIDANEYHAPASAVGLISRLEPYDLAWVEDPIPGGDIEGFATLRGKVRVPLEAGQLGSPNDVLRYIRMGAADCFKIKVVRGGGLLKLKKSLAIAEAANMSVVSGSGGDNDINFAAEVAINGSSRHMSRACESTGAWFIYSEKSRLVKEPIVVKEGYAYLRDKPGLGVELIESDFNKLAEKFPL
ncbi:MAG: mandelate racemase/muconate lactonizing enzyme family protein [Deltaproteobacteria bacterium]|nr:mandelate racemase/muconate lactonizing enzyme family protein [Deltaproteobacteria bacterium]MBI3063951.1 mandelate racemase/muconate lactonizing enzyme family protein [Deltaproteobacteria bacterium]